MTQRANRGMPVSTPTRRQLIAGAGIMLGGLATSTRLWGRPQQMAKNESTAGEAELTALHQEVEFNATPQRIYEALLNAKQFAAFTSAPAEIDRTAGGAFSLFGGLILGRNVELVPNKRIVQAWRPGDWEAGVYSIVKFELTDDGAKTKVILDHTGFPKGNFGHLSSGWHEHYWEPLKKYLA